MFWDYLSNNQESVHQVMHLFSDRGTPYSYRMMNGYSGHTYKFTKPDGSFRYVQIHLKTDQGNKTLNNDEAGKLASENPDHNTQDLFDAIEKGDFPSWTVYVQVMTPEQAEKFKHSIFDLTKVWPQSEFPLRKFGKLTLNENPKNYFADVLFPRLFSPLTKLTIFIDRASCLLPLPSCTRCRTLRGPSSPIPSLLIPRHPPPPSRRQLPTDPRQLSSQSLLTLPA